MQSRTVRQVMDTETYAIRDNEPVLKAVRLLVRAGVTGAPVVDDQGHCVGMITERECLALLTGLAGGDVPSGTVRNHMVDVESVGPETDVFYVAGLMRGQGVRRLPVVGAGRLLGVVTRKDILRALEFGVAGAARAGIVADIEAAARDLSAWLQDQGENEAAE